MSRTTIHYQPKNKPRKLQKPKGIYVSGVAVSKKRKLPENAEKIN
jgi:ABC-type Fe3+ transport system substrate-binding protein